MALRQMKTLGDMALEVLDRCAIPSGLGDDLLPQVHAFVREGQKAYWTKFPSIRARMRVDVTLTTGVATYDVPDIFAEPGAIEGVVAHDTNGVEWNLESGIRAVDRSTYALATFSTAFEPSRYQLHDAAIEVIGKPPATTTKLIVTGVAAPGALAESDQRPTIDDELLIRYAAIKLRRFKKQLSSPEYQSEIAELDAYADDLDGANGTGEAFRMGGQWLDPAEQYDGSRRQRPWWQANRRP